MPLVELPYVDAALDHLDRGGPAYLWGHLHWGLYDDPHDEDDSPSHYQQAAEAMTGRIVASGEVSDGSRVLDVGCGFGGTLDFVGSRHKDCQLSGVNIDERQLRWARRLANQSGKPMSWILADGCSLPVADNSVDHVLAVECVFHFPSRKRFFREAARVLRPGGTLAISDFILAPGALIGFWQAGENAGLGGSEWFGYGRRPLTSEGYTKLARPLKFEQLVDEDVTERTLPTYAAIRRLYRETQSDDGIPTIDGLEKLATSGEGWEYHVLSFRKKG